MLAGKRTSEFDDQIAQFEHRGAKLRDAVGREEVEVDAAMHAAFAEMSIVSRRREIITREHRDEPPQKITEARRRHRAILRAGPSARLARDQRACAKPGLADTPDCALIGGIG